MVEISIHYNAGSREWIILELQGSIETHNALPLKDVGLGDLHFTAQGIPMLILGHHLLKGRIVTLTNPLAVFVKQTKPLNDTTASELEADQLTYDYEIVALVKKKILFSIRPKPILVKYETQC